MVATSPTSRLQVGSAARTSPASTRARRLTESVLNRRRSSTATRSTSPTTASSWPSAGRSRQRIVTYQRDEGWTPPCVPVASRNVHDRSGLRRFDRPAVGGSTIDPSVSADGRYVAFTSDTADVLGVLTRNQVYVRDRVAGVTKLVTDLGRFAHDGRRRRRSRHLARTARRSRWFKQRPHRRWESPSNVWVARSTSGYFDTAAFDLVSYGVSGRRRPCDAASGPSMSSTGRVRGVLVVGQRRAVGWHRGLPFSRHGYVSERCARPARRPSTSAPSTSARSPLRRAR